MTSHPSKGQRTRKAILDAIVALANDTPLADIKVADICARSGIATGAFYFHFSGKDEALHTAATDVVTALFEQILARPVEADLYSELRGVLDVFYQARHERGPAIRALYVILAEHRPVRMAWIDIRKRLIARLEAAFTAAAGEGGRGFASPYVLAQFLLGALERFYDDVFFFPPDARLPGEAASHDVFVHQQARVWFRAVTGRDTP